MKSDGPIIIIEDDRDDQEIFQEVFLKLDYPNEILFFYDGQKAYDFLSTTDTAPFLILSDINMPCMTSKERRLLVVSVCANLR